MHSSAAPADQCLQCGKSRAEVRDPLNSPCATASGYEVMEALHEWLRHHWRDWSDRELRGHGVHPEAFARHRRTDIYSFEYLACDDSTSGHNVAADDYPEFGIEAGQCWKCGVTPAGWSSAGIA